MKIKLLSPRSDGASLWVIASEIEVDDAEGKRLCEMGEAVPVVQRAIDERETRQAPKKRGRPPKAVADSGKRERDEEKVS
jgi:hypothetical protein